MITTPNLKLWCRFDGNVNDETKNYTPTSSGLTYVSGLRGGQGAVFDATGDYVQIAHNASNDFGLLDVMSGWTVVMNFRIPSLAVAQFLFSKQLTSAPFTGWGAYIQSNGIFSLFRSSPSTSCDFNTGINFFPLNTDIHLSIGCAGGNTNAAYAVFMNGINVTANFTSTVTTLGAGDSMKTSAPFTIGNRGATLNGNMTISDFQFYNFNLANRDKLRVFMGLHPLQKV